MTNFKFILEQAKNDELIEEREKQKCSNNFIIHELEEKGTNIDAVNNNDAKMIKLFFGKINIEARPTKFYRLGKPTPNKNRPLKLEMTNNTKSDAVMRNLNRRDTWKTKRKRRFKMREIMSRNMLKWPKKRMPISPMLGEVHQAIMLSNKAEKHSLLCGCIYRSPTKEQDVMLKSMQQVFDLLKAGEKL